MRTHPQLIIIALLLFLLFSQSITSTEPPPKLPPVSHNEGCYGYADNYKELLGCEKSQLTGLKFCTMMNGQSTDEAYNTKHVQIEGKDMGTYAQYYDQKIAEGFKQASEYLNKAYVKDNAGIVCDTCMEKLKAMVCANAFPASGFRSCLANNVLKTLNDLDKKCHGLCKCSSDGLCIFSKNGDKCGLNTPKSMKQWWCLTRKSPDIGKMVNSCNHYFTPLKDCIDTLNNV
jgi:hypothetical protein